MIEFATNKNMTSNYNKTSTMVSAETVPSS